MTTRRGFLASLLAASTLPTLSWADAGSPAFLACAKEADGSYALYGITAGGADTFRIPLPARGHAGAGHPDRPEAVFFARRPGAYALVVDCAVGKVRHRLEPPEGRQFNGHGAFLQEGAILVTSEQMADGSAGRLGIWDADGGYLRIGELSTGGIGPHEVLLMADGRTLAVANGGIRTDATDRTKLNLPDMRPNLAYMTLEDGLVEQVSLQPDLHFNSIRHLATRDDGLLAFAMQWEGPAELAPPLLGLHRRGKPLTLAAAPEGEQVLMQNYAGSIAMNGAGTEIAITSPRGGRVQRFDASGQFIGALARADVCGAATLPDGFLLTDGMGGLLKLSEGRAHPLGLRARAWDNHVVGL